MSRNTEKYQQKETKSLIGQTITKAKKQITTQPGDKWQHHMTHNPWVRNCSHGDDCPATTKRLDDG